MANGDEYFAELDYIETVEKFKEDYEAEVMEDEEVDRCRPKTPLEEEEEEEVVQQVKLPFNTKKRYNYLEDNDFMPSHQLKNDNNSGIRCIYFQLIVQYRL